MVTDCTQVNGTIGADTVIELVPDSYDAGDGAYVVVWQHGVGGGATDITTNDALLVSWYQTVIDAGCILAASDAAGNNWGNTAGLTAYAAQYARLIGLYNVLGIIILTGSMGGASSLLCGINETYTNLLGMYLVYPVCSLANLWNNGFGQSPDLSGSIAAAYGISTGSEYPTKTAGHDPLLYDATAFPTVRYRMTGSYSDVTVPRIPNEDAFQTQLYTKSPHCDESDIVTTTGVHGDSSNIIPSDLAAFLNRCLVPETAAWRAL